MFAWGSWQGGRARRGQGCRRVCFLSPGRFVRAADLREDLVFLENHEFLVVDLDVVAAIFAEKDAIAYLYVESDGVTLLIDFAGAYGDDFALLGFLFCRVRYDDAALNGFFLFQPADEHTVVERSDIDSHFCDSSDGPARSGMVC